MESIVNPIGTIVDPHIKCESNANHTSLLLIEIKGEELN